MSTRRKTRAGTAANPHAEPHTAPIPTIIEFLLDETGSMQQFLTETIGGFNDFLAEQKRDAGLGTCLQTLTKFNSDGLRTPYVDLTIGSVPELTERTFRPAAMTNLRDAIMARITTVANRLTLWDITPRVLLVVMTDGSDNASTASIADTRAALQAATERGWTPIYLGAHVGVSETARALGFAEGNIRSFAGAEMRRTMQDLGTATTAFRASSASTTANFFAA